MDGAHATRHDLIVALRVAAVLGIPGSMLGAQIVEEGLVPLRQICAGRATAGSATEATLIAASALSPRFTQTALRPLSALDARRLAAEIRSDSTGCGGPWVRPVVQAWLNSSSSNPDNDGAVWQGRGVTAAATGGLKLERGFFSAVIQPVVFVTTNLEFRPEPASDRVAGDLRHPTYRGEIDLPYRMGHGALAQIHPGESSAQMAWREFSLALTSGTQHWGPAHVYPLVIGTDGPGYPRAAFQARSVSVGLGKLTGEWQLGWLEASPVSGLAPGRRSRVSAAAMGSFTPRGLTGLEFGGTRFFHVRRDERAVSWSTATLPFSGLVKKQSRDAAAGGFNQLASAFLRIAPPGSGAELYAEFYREDHNVDLRDLFAEPDHISAYVVGFRRTRRRGTGLRMMTLEAVNSRISHLDRVRSQGPIYTHTFVTEGHTHRGQTIGSFAAMGGSGATVVLDAADTERSTRLALEALVTNQTDEGGRHRGRLSGAYAAEVGHHRRIGRQRLHTWVRLRSGYGDSSAGNLTVGTSWHP